MGIGRRDLVLSFIVVLLGASIFTGLLESPAHAALTSYRIRDAEVSFIDSSYTWSTGWGVQCTGGDLSDVTVGQWTLTNYPSVYLALDTQTKYVLDHVYNGTVCVSGATLLGAPTPSTTGRFGLAAVDGSGTQPSSGTFGGELFGACPSEETRGTAANPGCVTAYTFMLTSYWFHFRFNYAIEDSMEADIYLSGDAFTWTPTATAFSDNQGNAWGLAMTRSDWTYSDHTGNRLTGSGNGTWYWFYEDPFLTAQKVQEARVHVGVDAIASQAFEEVTATQSLCYWTTFKAATMEIDSGGWNGSSCV